MIHILNTISGPIAKISDLNQTSSTPHLQLSFCEERYSKKETKQVWHNITVWGKDAESAAKHLRPGSTVTVEFRVDYKKAEGKTFTNFNATSITYLSGFGHQNKDS